MAYLAFQEVGGVVGGLPTHVAAPRRDMVATERLTALEWAVVALARRDGRSSLRAGRVATLLDKLFRRPNPRLANARLEALRRVAVLIWRGGPAVSPRERQHFLAAGFTAGQLATLVAGIGDGTTSRGSVGRQTA